jgi:hypothetical protein
MEDRFGGEVIRNQIRVRSERRIFPAEMIRVPAAFTESPGEETFNFGTACFDGLWSAMRLTSCSGLRNASLHTLAQDFPRSNSAKTASMPASARPLGG